MILLNGHSLGRKDWFRVETMALNLEERNSTATITIGPEAPEIAINDWLQDDTEPGTGIVWRVRTVTKNVETRTRTIQLEHINQLLKDRILFGEIKPDTITGNSSAETCTAWEAADYIMRRQTEWRLGQIEGSRSAPYNFNGDTLFTALETVTGSLPDMQWEYDLRSMPFTLNIVRHPTGFQSEMRMRRNISTMRIQIDKTRMYTRLYPIGKNNLHISGDYVSKNERVWGRVDKVLTDQTRESEEDLLGWAQDNLNRHCEPLVTVTITGLELSASTGEPLDHIVVGRRCRVPIPKYGIWMTERVTKMSWADKVKEPEKVTVTLANQLEDVASIINQQNTSTASSSASGRRGAKQAEEDHAWFVDTTGHVAMVAEAVAGEGASKDWSRVSEVLVDGQGIHQRVTYAEGEIVKQDARIDINEKRILQEVTDRTRADSTLSGRITTQADKVAIVVEEKNGQNVVKAASIVTAINDAGSSVAIDADHVNITGTTKLNSVMTVRDGAAVFNRVVTFNGSTGSVSINNGTVNATTLQGHGLKFIDSGDVTAVYTIAAADAGGIIKDASVANNILTLTKVNGAKVTFSKATQLSGSWSGGIYTVSAKQGTTEVATLEAKATFPKTTQTSNPFIDVMLYNKSDDASPAESTRYTVNVDNTYAYISWGSTTVARRQHSIYKNGWDAAYGKVNLPKSTQTANAFIDVYYPDSAVDETANTRYTVSADNDYAYLKWGSTTVARATNPAYGNGWAAAYGKVSLPKSAQTANAFIDVKTPNSTAGTAEAEHEVHGLSR